MQTKVQIQDMPYHSKNSTRRWLHNVRYDWVKKKIMSMVKPESCVLEVGVGGGIYTTLLSQQCNQVFCLDLDEEFLTNIASLPHVTTRLMSICNFHEESQFDVAICSEVIEHFIGSDIALKNIFRSLKPGGCLILTTPNSYSTMECMTRLLSSSFFCYIAQKLYGEHVGDIGHINRLTHGQLKHQIRDAGFQILEHDNCGFYLPLITEMGGGLGTGFLAFSAAVLKHIPFCSSLLWTQCWLLKRPLT